MKIRTYLLAVGGFLALFALTQHALAAGLNGVNLGDKPSPATLKAQLGVTDIPPGPAPRGGARIASGMHVGFTQLAGLPVTIYCLIEDDGSVSAITVQFQPLFFDRIAAEMSNKFGKPASEGRVQQSTAAGFVVQNVELDWELPDHQSASMLKYALEIGHGTLMIETAQHRERRAGLYSNPPVPR